MQFDVDYWQIKILFDFGGYIMAIGWIFLFKKYFLWKNKELKNIFPSKGLKWEYYLLVICGAMIGATIISTFDGCMIPWRCPEWWVLLSKSIAGALFWWVITAEAWKYFHRIKTPTGILFLPGILVGVFFGRLGALATWLRDFTYGLPTSLPWWIDFWDGILRHPTMIYEMVLLFLFFIALMIWLKREPIWWTKNGFYLFIGIYFFYRFLVGFIQPYSHFWWWFSTYQLIAIPMITYSIYMVKRHS